jgi:hypothetical protein
MIPQQRTEHGETERLVLQESNGSYDQQTCHSRLASRYKTCGATSYLIPDLLSAEERGVTKAAEEFTLAEFQGCPD